MAFREKLEYGVTATLLNISRILPERAVYGLFKSFALLFYHAGGRRRGIAVRNTEIAFPDKPLKERKDFVRGSYLILSESFALSLLIMTRRVSKERLRDMVETDDWHRVERALADTGAKGLLSITGHLGNWELMSQYFSLRLERQLHVVARQGNNRLIDDRIVRPMREHFGVSVFYKKNALMRMVKAIHRGDVCGTLIDQKLNPPEGIYVDLFGKPAPTSNSVALLQIRFDITVLPIFMVKSGHRKYRMIIEEPVPWTDNGNSFEEQVADLTLVHQRIIEDMVRRYPDQWFWAHNRWGLPRVKK
jgi:KDO2-lipid IV(A) lauroyltransferase